MRGGGGGDTLLLSAGDQGWEEGPEWKVPSCRSAALEDVPESVYISSQLLPPEPLFNCASVIWFCTASGCQLAFPSMLG